MADDQYAELRAALAAGPAIGPYIVDQDNGNGIVVVDGRGYIVAEANYGDVPSEYGPGFTETIIREVRSTHLYIAAAHPTTITALLAERDALLEALDSIRQYGRDTLTGRVDGPDDRDWQRGAVREMTHRAHAAIERADGRAS